MRHYRYASRINVLLIVNRYRANHRLSRSFSRFFFTCSLGLIAPPSSHDSTLPTVMTCSSSGAFTRIVDCVAGPKVISANALCRNTAMASTAALYRLSAGIRTECSCPPVAARAVRRRGCGHEFPEVQESEARSGRESDPVAYLQCRSPQRSDLARTLCACIPFHRAAHLERQIAQMRCPRCLVRHSNIRIRRFPRAHAIQKIRQMRDRSIPQ